MKAHRCLRIYCSSNQRSMALTRLEVLVIIITIAILSVLLWNFVFVKSKCTGSIRDLSNVKNVALAFRIFAADNNDMFPQMISTNNGGSLEFTNNAMFTYKHFAAMSNELYTPKILVSPMQDDWPRIKATTFSENINKQYDSGLVPFNTNKNISYYVGLNADETQPQALLTGWRMITNSLRPTPTEPKIIELVDDKWGVYGANDKTCSNIGLGDGSADSLSLKELRRLVDSGKIHALLSLPD